MPREPNAISFYYASRTKFNTDREKFHVHDFPYPWVGEIISYTSTSVTSGLPYFVVSS